ncbi:MAG: CoA pyrophosphatase [Syntrophales bacterium]|nr:CoA pyrophosphatase [Syntrophales bacterium]
MQRLATLEKLLPHVISRLGACDLDYWEKWTSIHNSYDSSNRHSAAGVLLLLRERDCCYSNGRNVKETVVLFIKRSTRVSQSGDLGFPGGLLNPKIDTILRLFIVFGGLPIFKGKARELAKIKGKKTYYLISLFLANALREAWEEIRLNPFEVSYLGALPTRSLVLFKCTIFPLVGYVKGKQSFSNLSGEVEKVVEIPLLHFLDVDRYGSYIIDAPPPVMPPNTGLQSFPCFIYEEGGAEEILWGATFAILLSFLQVVFDFVPPVDGGKRRCRTLLANYLTGERD